MQDSSVVPPGKNKEIFSVKFRESLVEDQASYLFDKNRPILEGFLSYSRYHCHHATIAISHIP